MDKFKKIIGVILLACLLLPAAACVEQQESSGNLDPKNPITITFWHYYSDKREETLMQLVDEFNTTVGLEKGIIVDPINKGKIFELENAITDSANGVINSEKMPNIFSSYIDKVVELDELGKVVNLNEHFSEDEKSGYVSSFLGAGMYEDKFLVAPLVKSMEILYVNKTAWDTYKALSGADDKDLKTWEGLTRISADYQKRLKENPASLPADKAFFGMDSDPNFIIIGMKNLGVDVIDSKNKQALLDKKALRKLFDVYFKNMVEGTFYANGKLRTDNIKTGEIISYVGSTSSASYFPLKINRGNEEEAIDLLALEYPTFEGKKPHYFLQGAGLCVSNGEDAEVEASVEFLKWFTNDDNNFRFAVDTGYLPARKVLYEKDELNKMIKELQNNESGKNVAKVFESTKDQILSESVYYSLPFNKSYQIREILSKTLNDQVLEVTENPTLKDNLNYDEAFNEWMHTVKLTLERNDIQYQVR